MVTRTRFSVTLYVHCVPCLFSDPLKMHKCLVRVVRRYVNVKILVVHIVTTVYQRDNNFLYVGRR